MYALKAVRESCEIVAIPTSVAEMDAVVTQATDRLRKLAEDFGYEVLCLPMEYDPARARVTTIGFSDSRTEPGELLCPERFGAEEVEAAKRVMGPDYQTQYNQDPQPYEGVLFQRAWFDSVEVLPIEGLGRGVRFWDCAATEMAPGRCRAAHRLDANQAVIVEALCAELDVSVFSLAGVAPGCPDLLVGGFGA